MICYVPPDEYEKLLALPVIEPRPGDVWQGEIPGRLWGMEVVKQKYLLPWVVVIEADGEMQTIILWNDAYREHLAERFRSKGWRARVGEAGAAPEGIWG